MKSHIRRVAVLISVAAMVALGATAPANAYVHAWSGSSNPEACDPVPNNTRCYDNQGNTYNPWNYTRVNGAGLEEVCVKAITSSNNLRSTTNGSGNAAYCGYTGTRIVPLVSSLPESRAYVYWNWSGPNTAASIGGYASTP